MQLTLWICVIVLVIMKSPRLVARHVHLRKGKAHLKMQEQQLALLHSQKVSEAGSCDIPKIQVIHVGDHYPGRYYMPHCTLLHRCGKHSGCCGSDNLRCVATTKEKVSLYFYSVRLNEEKHGEKHEVVKLTFTNHTRCGCLPIKHIQHTFNFHQLLVPSHFNVIKNQSTYFD